MPRELGDAASTMSARPGERRRAIAAAMASAITPAGTGRRTTIRFPLPGPNHFRQGGPHMTALRTATFREQLEAAVLRRHCANHPMTEKWAKGELSRNARMGWAVEHYHWGSNIWPAVFQICARAQKDAVQAQLENYREENDDTHPHLDIVLRFAETNGADIAAVKKGRGLPTTESWVRFLCNAADQPSWIAVDAAVKIGDGTPARR